MEATMDQEIAAAVAAAMAAKDQEIAAAVAAAVAAKDQEIAAKDQEIAAAVAAAVAANVRCALYEVVLSFLKWCQETGSEPAPMRPAVIPLSCRRTWGALNDYL